MNRLPIVLAVVAIVLGAFAGIQPAAAQSGNQWQVYYYPNLNWQGAPVYTQPAGFVSFNWGSDTPPTPYMPAQNWTARATTTAYFYPGIYTFQVQADDEFALYVDGVLYGDTRGANQPGKPFQIDIPFTQGNHFVQVDYRQYTGPAYLYVNWSYNKGGYVPPPGPGPVPPPAPAPAPQPVPPAGSLVTDYGDYTRCAQQQIHQSNCFQSNGAWNAPNMGSIQMEPQIVVWQRCTADQVQTMQLYVNQAPQRAKCSKTEAGWFPS